MRQPYQPPELTTLGTVVEMTQSAIGGDDSDNLSWLPFLGPIFGDDTFS